VAIISGRAHAELRELVGIPAIVYAGNHGMEISGPGFEFIEPTAQAAARDLHLLGEAIAHNLADVPGVFVEDKGLTLSVHYRRVPPLYCEKVWHAVYDIVAKHRDEFHLTLGNKVYEIRPNVSWNKGAAIGWIREQVGTSDTVVIYIGDDTTDEDAFLALGEDAVTIRVCDHGHTAASFILQDPTTVQQFLHWIAELRSSDQENVLESAVEKGAVP
jgi:trehalose-phosphatase